MESTKISLNKDSNLYPKLGLYFGKLPKEICDLVIQKLRPYEMLQLSQTNAEWRSALDISEYWGITQEEERDVPEEDRDRSRTRTQREESKPYRKTTTVWNDCFRGCPQSELLQQEQRVQDALIFAQSHSDYKCKGLLSARARIRVLFELRRLIFEHVYSNFSNFWGFPARKVTQLYMKGNSGTPHPGMGNLNFINTLPLPVQAQIAEGCMDAGNTGLVLRYDWGKSQRTAATRKQILSSIRKEKLGAKLEIAIASQGAIEQTTAFYNLALEEIKRDPQSPLSLRLGQIMDQIFTNARGKAYTEGHKTATGVFGIFLEYNCIKALFGFGWGLATASFVKMGVFSLTCGVVKGAWTYYKVKWDEILRLISQFPDYQIWKDQLFDTYLIDLLVATANAVLPKTHFCPISSRLLIEGMKAPDGSVYDQQAILEALEKTPSKYTFESKDLQPDYVTVNTVYNDLIAILKELTKALPNTDDFTPSSQRLCLFLEEGKKESLSLLHTSIERVIYSYFLSGKSKDFVEIGEYDRMKRNIESSYKYYYTLFTN